MSGSVKYSRVLVKLSGEALAGPGKFGLDTETLNYIAGEIASVHSQGTGVAVVVGGGNFIRGEAFSETGGIERTVADQMGMLSTIINGMALQAAIERFGIQSRLQSAIHAAEVAEPFIRRRAIRHLEKQRVVIFGGGTGNPYFTTDTAAVLRALEIGADVLIKATQVDGIYDKDPHKHDDAVKFENLGYDEAISKRLAVMDQTAFTLCQENELPLIVLDLKDRGAMAEAVKGKPIGTLVGTTR